MKIPRTLSVSLLVCCSLAPASAADPVTAPPAKTPPGKKLLILPGTPSSDLTWPMPPDPPRVKWLAEYTDMAKVRKPEVKKANWLDKFTGAKTADEKLELRKPYGVTTDSRGRIYAADTEMKMVFVIDAINKVVETRESSSRAPLSLPVGLAVDAADRLFVSDADLHTITCFGTDGKPVANFGTNVLSRPGGIALDKQRNRLYVVDVKKEKIFVFDTNTFEVRSEIGGPSKPGKREKGKFTGPTNIAVGNDGNLYVADTGNQRIEILDSNGLFIRAFGAQGDRPGEFIRPKGIAVDSEGHIYVADAEFNNFQILTKEGQPLLAVGTLGTRSGEFALVAGIHVDAKDRIYTSEMLRGRIQVFQYLSQPDTPVKKEVKTAAIR